MKLIARLTFSLITNALVLLAAAEYVEDFKISGSITGLLSVAAIFTAINIFIKPFLKFIFTPLIILTFGLGILVINAAMLWLLDFFSDQVTISSIEALFYTTLLISVINFLINISARYLFRN